MKGCFQINYITHDKKDNDIIGISRPDFYSRVFKKISAIYLSNSEIFESFATRTPRNHINMFIDFKRSPLSINLYTIPSNPTDNGSVANIYGYEEDYLAAFFARLEEFFEDKKNKHGFLHKSGVYYVFLFFVYFPSILWAFFKIENMFLFFDIRSKILIFVLYIYLFLFVAIVGRVIFQYMKWLFPIVDYTTEKMGPRISSWNHDNFLCRSIFNVIV